MALAADGDDDPDDRLLSRYTTAGDRAAMDALVRRHVAFVHATARREVGDDHQAEDVTQAVFLLLTRRARSVPLGRLRGWLFLATRHAAANARKTRARRMRHERLASERGEPVAAPASDDANPLLPLLNDALASLGPRDREAVILRYLQGRGVDDVRAALGVTEAAARKRLTRAIERLRRFFAAHGVPVATNAGRFGAALVGTSAPPAPDSLVTAVLAATAGGASAGASVLANGSAIMIQASKAKVVAAAGAGVLLLVVSAGVAVRYATSGSHAAGSSAGANGGASSPESVKADAAAVFVVVKALNAYGEKHGRWPDRLDELVAAGLLDAGDAGPPGAPRYVYNKPPTTRHDAAEFLMLRQARGSSWEGPLAVAYGDGHVAVVRDRQRFDQLLRSTRDARAKRR